MNMFDYKFQDLFQDKVYQCEQNGQKPKLLIIGNKVLDDSYSYLAERIDNEFDVVVRLNRMNNYKTTGFRTDVLFVDPHKTYFNMVFDEQLENDESRQRFKYAKQLIVTIDRYQLDQYLIHKYMVDNKIPFSQMHEFQMNNMFNLDFYGMPWQNKYLGMMFSQEQLTRKKLIKLDLYNKLPFQEFKYYGCIAPVTSFRLIMHFVEYYQARFDIYICGLDIDGRGNLQESFDKILKINRHYLAYEEYYLKKLIADQKIKLFE